MNTPSLIEFSPPRLISVQNHQSEWTRGCWRCTANSECDAKACAGYDAPLGDYSVWCEHDNFSDICSHPKLPPFPKIAEAGK